jgi:hypothetical protein
MKMTTNDIDKYCDLLCNKLEKATDETTSSLTRSMMSSLKSLLFERDINKDDYVWLFVNVAAICRRYATRIGHADDPSLGRSFDLGIRNLKVIKRIVS